MDMDNGHGYGLGLDMDIGHRHGHGALARTPGMDMNSEDGQGYGHYDTPIFEKERRGTVTIPLRTVTSYFLTTLFATEPLQLKTGNGLKVANYF
jgi:hypothetical protein